MVNKQSSKAPSLIIVNSLYLGVMLLIILSGILFAPLTEKINTSQTILLNAAVEILVIGVPCLGLLLFYRRNIRGILRLNRPRLSSLLLTLGMAVTGYIVTVFVSLLWYGVLSRFGEPALQQIPSVSTVSEYGAALLGLCLVPAVVEEIMFRGILLTGYRRTGKIAAIGLSGVLFGIYHVTLMTIPSIILLGIAIAFTVQQTNSIYCGILFHFVFNLISTSLTFLQGYLVKMSEMVDVTALEGGLGGMPSEMMAFATVFWGVMALGALAVFMLFAYLMKKQGLSEESEYPSYNKRPLVIELIPLFITAGIIIFFWVVEIMSMLSGSII